MVNPSRKHVPLVSVIVPCYKQAVYLKETIKSISQQSIDCEVIVINDGSPDNVAEVCSHYPAVIYLEQKNSGAAVARNLGLNRSTGEFIIFLDADDRLLPNAVSSLRNFLEANESCAFVSGQVCLIDGKGRPLETPQQTCVDSDHFKSLLSANYIWTPGCVMYRATFLHQQKGFDPAAGGSADYELNIRLARLYPVGCLSVAVLEYRTHQENMSSNLAYMLRSGVSVRKRQYQFVKDDRTLREAWVSGIHTVRADVGTRLWGRILKATPYRLAYKKFLYDLKVLILFDTFGWIRVIKQKFVK